MTARRLSLFLAILMLLSLLSACKSKSSDGADGTDREGTSSDRDSGIASTSGEIPDSAPVADDLPIDLPFVSEDGRLQIASLFPFTGMNPDANGKMGENIATLEVANVSDKYLNRAELSLTLSDGTTLSFTVTDLPSGKTVWAFEPSCKTCPDGTPDIVSFACTVDFADEAPTFPDTLTVAADDITVALTNTGNAELTNLTVYCHCLFSEVFFGGITYAYTVDRIPTGETVTLTATDCFLGEAQVVRIETDDTNP